MATFGPRISKNADKKTVNNEAHLHYFFILKFISKLWDTEIRALLNHIWQYSYSEDIERQAISNLGTNALNVLIFACTGILATVANNMNPMQFNEHPAYYFIYFYNLILPSLIAGTVSTIYYTSHDPMRKMLWREIKNKLGILQDHN